MANHSRSLDCQLGWPSVLSRLGMTIPQVIVLPQTILCPLCKDNGVNLSDHQLLGGDWTNCRGCNFAGDLIELAAALWQVEAPAAVARVAGSMNTEDAKDFASTKHKGLPEKKEPAEKPKAPAHVALPSADQLLDSVNLVLQFPARKPAQNGSTVAQILASDWHKTASGAGDASVMGAEIQQCSPRCSEVKIQRKPLPEQEIRSLWLSTRHAFHPSRRDLNSVAPQGRRPNGTRRCTTWAQPQCLSAPRTPCRNCQRLSAFTPIPAWI